MPKFNCPSTARPKMPRLLSRLVLLGCCFWGGLAAADDVLPEMVFTQAPETELMVGDQVVAVLPQWTHLTVNRANGRYYHVDVNDYGINATGWVLQDATVLPQSFVIEPDSANVMSQSDVVGTVHRNQSFPLSRTNGNWVWLALPGSPDAQGGWVNRNQIRLVPPTYTAESSAGQPATSVAIAQIQVDWTTEAITLQAEIGRVSPDSQLKLISESVESAEGVNAVTATFSDRIMTLTANAESLASSLTQGTRSLWVEESTSDAIAWHRVDLPVPELSDAVTAQRFANFEEGLVLYLPINHVIPGFQLEFTADETQPFTKVSSDPGAVPRLSDVYPRQNGELALRVILPFAATADAVESFIFRIRAVDGSVSRTIHVGRTGDQVAGSVLQELAPSPVDATSQVPSLGLLTAAEARERLELAGFAVRVVDGLTYRATERSVESQALVIRQGLPAGSRRLLGSVVLLAVQPDGLLQRQLATVVQETPAIDVSDDFGYVAIVPRRPRDESSLAVPSAVNTDVEMSEEATIVSLSTHDLGVDIVPDRDADSSQSAAFSRLLVDNIEQSPSWRNLQGPVGEAFSQAMSDARSGDEELGSVEQVREITRACESALHLNLSAQQQARLEQAWNESVESTLDGYHLDRNANGDNVDDLVLWVLRWLIEQEQYDPLASATIIAEQPGSLTIAFGEELSIEGTEIEFEAPVAGSTSESFPEIPTAEAIVRASRAPDQIRVPEVIGLSAAESSAEFDGLGTHVREAGDYFNDDRITAVTPREGTWMIAADGIAIDVERRIPDVVGYASGQAEEHLRSRGFAPLGSEERLATDIVIKQSPSAGVFAVPGADVDLVSAVIVPPVVGQSQQVAEETLQGSGLDWRADTLAFTVDRVVDQNPTAGHLRRRGDSVLLTLHVPVPNLDGLALSAAEELLGEWDLENSVTNGLARGGDLVRGQNPQAGEYVPHRSEIVLGPVRAIVPDLVGQTIQDAIAEINRQDFQGQYNVDRLLLGDGVTGQSPEAGEELERGESIVLDGRVIVPGAQQDDMSDRLARLNNAPGDLRVEIDAGYNNSDPVYSQDPSPGTRVYPRTLVVVSPGVVIPDVRNLTAQQAIDRLNDTGVAWRSSVVGERETVNQNLVGEDIVLNQSVRAGLHARRNINEVSIGLERYILALRTVPAVYDDGQEWYPNASEAIRIVHQAELRVELIDLAAAQHGETEGISGDAYLRNLDDANLAALLNELFGVESTAPVEPIVVGQDPPAGTSVVRDSIVRVYVQQARTY